jgi:hypothetical protein
VIAGSEKLVSFKNSEWTENWLGRLADCIQAGRAHNEYLEAGGRVEDDAAALFRPTRNKTSGQLDKAITPIGIYKLARTYSGALGIGAYAAGR